MKGNFKLGKINDVIYVYSNAKAFEYTYTGISFSEFIEFLREPIQNIVILNGNYMGDSFRKNFEIFVGKDSIEKLSNEVEYGEFSFVDCLNESAVETLSNEEIAEILYLGHMKYPLNSPFFYTLKNRFVYLSNDNSFYCKVYCKLKKDVGDVIEGKIKKSIYKILGVKVKNLSKEIKKKLINSFEKGILIDFQELKYYKKNVIINIYCIGKYKDMDQVLNNKDKYKCLKNLDLQLMYSRDEWSVVFK